MARVRLESEVGFAASHLVPGVDASRPPRFIPLNHRRVAVTWGRYPSPGDPRIRLARVRDAAAMRRIYNDAVQHTTATFDTAPRTPGAQRAWFASHDARHPVLVGLVRGKVVGWSSLSPWSDRRAYDGTAEVSVYVSEAWRRRGIGRALVSEILRRAPGCGLHTILARIVEGNPASRALHVSAGFIRVGTMHEVGFKFGRFLNVELMERPVARGDPEPPRKRAAAR